MIGFEFGTSYSFDAKKITDPKTALRTARVIWFALSAGVAFFWFIVAGVIGFNGKGGVNDDGVFLVILGVFLVVTVPVGRLVRNHIFKKGMVEGVVSPPAYMTGHIVSWACCEGVTFVGLIFTYFLAHNLFPMLLFPVISYLTMLLQFPRRKELFGVEDDAASAAGSEDKYGIR